MIDIPDLGEGFLEMWQELLLLAEQAPAPWTLIGAHMVAVHGWKAGRNPPRASRDADILVNARVVSRGTRKVSEILVSHGFSLDGVSPEGIGHRFVNGHLRFDILGPDGMGLRVNLQTLPGARTVEVPGGSQALKRSQMTEIRVRTVAGAIPVPSLLAAILVKARAIAVDDQPRAQRTDVAFLLSLVDDPDPLAAEISTGERRWLRHYPEFADPTSACYADVPNAVDATTVFRRLISPG
jgi:hypothetical protein